MKVSGEALLRNLDIWTNDTTDALPRMLGAGYVIVHAFSDFLDEKIHLQNLRLTLHLLIGCGMA